MDIYATRDTFETWLADIAHFLFTRIRTDTAGYFV